MRTRAVVDNLLALVVLFLYSSSAYSTPINPHHGPTHNDHGHLSGLSRARLPWPSDTLDKDASLPSLADPDPEQSHWKSAWQALVSAGASAWAKLHSKQPSSSHAAQHHDGWFRRRLSSAPRSAAASHDQAPKACHPDCTKRGNCNAAEGRCECPFGLQGEACEEFAFPACRTHNLTVAQAEAANVSLLTTCAEDMRLNCECYRQCWMHYCPNTNDCRIYRNFMQKCFIYRGYTAAQQVSTFPEPHWRRNVTYFQDLLGMFNTTNSSVFAKHDWAGRIEPPHRCQQGCNGRGICSANEVEVQGQEFTVTRCQCMQGYFGDYCEYEHGGWCLAGCSGRGRCVRGFCHCAPAYFGAGCMHKAAAPKEKPHGGQAGQGLSRTKLKIFMYDLPWEVAFQDGYHPGWQSHNAIYMAFWHFSNMLAADQDVLTLDPSQANMFFIPALSFYYSGNIGDPSLHMLDVISYIRQKHPYWDASGGGDHFYFALNDRGACALNSTHSELWAPIKLVHFGAFTGNASRDLSYNLPGRTHAGFGCFQPAKDIVMAPYHDGIAGQAAFTYGHPSGQAQFEAEKPILLAFAGDIRYHEPEYSGGVRQEMYTMFADNRTSLGRTEDGPTHWPAKAGEVLVHNGYTPWHDEWMKLAKFCLAPYGHGWGIRLSIVITAGCVPVIIQDHVFQPFEDLLPYDDFSIRLPATDLPRIREVLAAVSDQEWRWLHAGLKKVWPYFVWEAKAGGQAYSATISSLRKRMIQRQAGLASAVRRV